MKTGETKPMRLLLVEDSEADVYLVNEVMRREGLSVNLEVADNGEIAIQTLNRIDEHNEEPLLDLVLLDLNVPRKDGAQVLERLRRSSRCAAIPVVVISSSDSPRDRQRAFELGVTEYFRKPSSLAEFLKLGQLVRRLCEKAPVQT